MLSERTFAVLRRVGVALGARDGTGPDDDPMLGWHRRQGRAEGAAQGRAAARLEMVREMLRARGIAPSDESPAQLSALDAASDEAIVRAALACNGAADFFARLRG